MGVNRERQTVWKLKGDVYMECGSLTEAMKTIQSLIDTYGADAKLEYYTEPYSEGSRHLGVYVQEMESDEAMAARIAARREAEAAVKRQAALDKLTPEDRLILGV